MCTTESQGQGQRSGKPTACALWEPSGALSSDPLHMVPHQVLQISLPGARRDDA